MEWKRQLDDVRRHGTSCGRRLSHESAARSAGGLGSSGGSGGCNRSRWGGGSGGGNLRWLLLRVCSERCTEGQASLQEQLGWKVKSLGRKAKSLGRGDQHTKPESEVDFGCSPWSPLTVTQSTQSDFGCRQSELAVPSSFAFTKQQCAVPSWLFT
eukprot:2802267-Rhodomonas_salina.1